MTSKKWRNVRLKRYKHVIYIKECKSLAIEQSEQHILQRKVTRNDKKGEWNYHKLGKMRVWNLLYT